MSRSIRALLLALLMVACTEPAPGGGDGGSPDAGPMRCGPEDDGDGDLISSVDEGRADPDEDGIPNDEDDDSDGDGVSDRDEAGDTNCVSLPYDTDQDGTPDFLDLESNGDGVPDASQGTTDLDEDGVPDFRDPDVDGDGIRNSVEVGDDPSDPVDSDDDGTPDVLDLDSDGDTISDEHEGVTERDEDGLPAYLDLDSDGDGVNDADEAGDGELATAPVACPVEADIVTGEVRDDGEPDFLDTDSDDDGLADGQEVAIGSNPCDGDSDDDGVADAFEGAYVQVHCPDGPSAPGAEFCDCAVNADCTIPDDDYYVVLPFNAPPVTRTLVFGTEIRSADVFFLFDTTGSMGGTLQNAKDTVTEPTTGIVDRVRASIPDTWFGGGQHDDLPFSTWGAPPDDVAFGLASTMTSVDADVQSAIDGISIHSGIDPPEAQVPALHALFSGLGGTWEHRGPLGGVSIYTLPAYGAACSGGRWGAACFRPDALPIVVHFTDRCAHGGPPGEDLVHCNPYTGVTPALPVWQDAVDVMNERGARYVGVNAGAASCEGPTAPNGVSTCYFMRRTAEATRSVDLGGRPLVYDLPNESSRDAFVDTVVDAIDTIRSSVPFDVGTSVRGEPHPLADAARFVKRRTPGCRATPAIDPCWEAPEGTEHDDAVAGTDASTFFSVVPGTQVTFVVTFRNDFFEGSTQSELFIAHIEVRAGTAVLDEREVYVIVPARPVILI
ncbi:hypothetical protein [Sandaracinus amylolyticus]|uniref:hypothetical protein n=1 Tax=Sandaracinus amylolyticus TaxID=927083 RepID=UPI001F25DCA0|nr:hypothetical protein [Sandaracinus amylolyticus]UJR85781.1 Hypothetical protein I5071_78610 [Sandaracinus amylolyticus]